MKWVIAFTLVLSFLALSECRYHDLKHKTGDDILHLLKAGNHDIYMLAFYHPSEGHQHLSSSNHHLVERLQSGFLEKNDIKDLYFAAIDATNPTYSQLMTELEIDVDDLIVEPTLFLMEHGNGFVITGPRAIQEMKMNLNELLENRDHGF